MSVPQEFADMFSKEAYQRYKEVLKKDGYINFTELPDALDYIRFLEPFGNIVPQYDGQIIWSIKSDQRFSNVYHSLNNKHLLPHTECYEFEGQPPKYLALWCVKAAEDGGGQTTLADSYTFISSLTQEERALLASCICRFHSTAGLEKSKLGREAYHPIVDLSIDPNEPILRYSFACLDDMGNSFIRDIRQRILNFFERTCVPIFYQQNSLLVWDNWRMLHARTGFADQTRHLKRVWLSKKSHSGLELR